MDMNLTQLYFLTLALGVGGVGFLINTAEKYLPVFITRTYRYGKYAATAEHPLVSKLEVPKRWFKHFYVFAAPASTLVLVATIFRYFGDIPMPKFVNWLLDLQMGTGRRALVTPECTLLALFLFCGQCWKRWYETQRVSVFSDATFNISHYIVGFIHYSGALTCMIGESQGFVTGSSFEALSWDRLTYLQYLAAVVFVVASYEQLRTNYLLANLRRDSSGNVTTKSHKIPRGRLFEMITGPLQFTEIIMYAMLSIVLWQSFTYHYVFLWVLANQVETAVLAHQWYVQKFEDYPKQRKILVPYLF